MSVCISSNGFSARLYVACTGTWFLFVCYLLFITRHMRPAAALAGNSRAGSMGRENYLTLSAYAPVLGIAKLPGSGTSGIKRRLAPAPSGY